ncbi:DUF3016 domain-containing protein [Photobacterium aphoticum]|uniref:DUF3016 domain-containing protein n=1 Tax=Photobacterium aphoticum TaxID=754436 RepID=A0A0J1GHF1_9GAMM|nr:DUF3016 domain-containing protein [Photobacterium aphoticum]KLU99147.1 hypothetical protein ABT58_19245 [Photobacterium aphoticum]
MRSILPSVSLFSATWISASLWAVFSSGAMAHDEGNPTLDVPPVQVTWEDPQNYRDIQAATGSQSKFEASTFKYLTQSFSKNVKRYLPDGQTLQVTVTNLDLAGEVNIPRDVRVLDHNTPPRITFTYVVKDGDNVVTQGDADLSSLGYQGKVIGLARDRPYPYENQMIKEWAKKTF